MPLSRETRDKPTLKEIEKIYRKKNGKDIPVVEYQSNFPGAAYISNPKATYENREIIQALAVDDQARENTQRYLSLLKKHIKSKNGVVVVGVNNKGDYDPVEVASLLEFAGKNSNATKFLTTGIGIVGGGLGGLSVVNKQPKKAFLYGLAGVAPEVILKHKAINDAEATLKNKGYDADGTSAKLKNIAIGMVVPGVLGGLAYLNKKHN